MVELTPEQPLAAALVQIKELETVKEKAAQAESEITRLKESESSQKKKKLKNQASGSKTRFEPGTPFSSIIKQIYFSSFGTLEKDVYPNPHTTPDSGMDKTDVAIMMTMLQEIQKLHSKIENIPGVLDPIDLPKKFTVPYMKTYDGTSDPQNHVSIFKQKMLSASIPSELKQVCMCKGFGTTLTGAALQWFINLPNGSIKNFADLVYVFNQQFASNRDMTKRPSNLFRVKQLPDEPLKEFLARFVKEKVAIPRCDKKTAVEAFRQGVLLDSDIYADLTKKACPTFATVQSSVLEHIRLKEDLNFRTNSFGGKQSYGHTNRKSSYHKGSNSRSAPYSRPDRSKVNTAQEYKGNLSSLPTIPEYNSSINIAGLIKRLENFGDTGVPDLHHDSLVITMQIGTAKVSRILIDGGSSINLVMLDVLKAMKIDEEKITKKSSVLVGFSGETKNTLGEINLPTYAEGVASYERFGVLDCLSLYNVILGRPWIHNFKAIPSTYHQCVKIPTEWGITTIRGE
ncbi:uncharacterized protein LOC141602118 [Silene latifolia]|uniref:uncharacterized protein LOC141602118 n=1 Tax=Silene latifolia TaxID=37657 RepID=UPI003D7735CA